MAKLICSCISAAKGRNRPRKPELVGLSRHAIRRIYQYGVVGGQNIVKSNENFSSTLIFFLKIKIYFIEEIRTDNRSQTKTNLIGINRRG